jgi:hypothetical protein
MLAEVSVVLPNMLAKVVSCLPDLCWEVTGLNLCQDTCYFFLGFLQFCQVNVWLVPPARVCLLSSTYFLTHYYMLPFNAKSLHC